MWQNVLVLFHLLFSFPVCAFHCCSVWFIVILFSRFGTRPPSLYPLLASLPCSCLCFFHLLRTISPFPPLNLVSGGVGAVVKISASQSWGPRFDSRPGRGLNIWVTFFPAKVHSAFHPPGVSKMSTSIHGPIWSGCQRRLYMLPVRWG